MSALADRDVNAQSTSNPGDATKKIAGEENTSTEQPQAQKQLIKDIAESNGKPGQSYVSPSDAILSPASKKLANFKQNQITKQGLKKPAARTLFARNASSCSDSIDGNVGEDKV